jgi:circadian clock protein KaiC
MSQDDSQAVRAARAADAQAVGLGRSDGGIEKVPTGIPGFDHVAMGGLPRRRATVLAGQAGSAKTVFAGQFLAEGVRQGSPAVFVTLEEPTADLRANFTTLGWDIAAWEAQDSWRFVDASPLLRDDGTPVDYSFAALAAQIGQAVDATGAERIVLDSLNSVFSLEPDAGRARQRLRALIGSMRRAGLTIVLTVETPTDPADSLSRFGIEEFVADNVVLLRNARHGKGRRRTVEILKMRGSAHLKGDFGFTVLPREGVVVLPVTGHQMTPGRPAERVPSGIPDLDVLFGGGLIRDSIVLVSGPTGTGKTLLSVEFLAAAAAEGRSALFMGYEESPEQVGRNAVGRGRQFEALRAAGSLHVVSAYPEESALEDHLLDIKQLVENVRPERLVIDSLTALERAGSEQAYREFLVSLTAFLKEQLVTAVFTATTSSQGVPSRSDAHVSTLADTLIALRYAERPGRVDRTLTVLKMRGGPHDRSVRSLTIDDEGLHIGEPMPDLVGVIR